MESTGETIRIRMEANMFVTVAICTWNRAALLNQCLQQMTQLKIPDGVQWELVVVNNNCTDTTDSVLGRWVRPDTLEAETA